MAAIKQWFAQLNKREQQMLTLAAIVAIALLIYILLWAPVKEQLNKQRQALANERNLLTWVEEQSQRAYKLRQSSSTKQFTGSLTQLVNQSTRRLNISVSRMQPQNDNLQLSIDLIEFDRLLTWLLEVEQNGVQVLQSDITETEQPGLVQVRRLLLAKGQA